MFIHSWFDILEWDGGERQLYTGISFTNKVDAEEWCKIHKNDLIVERTTVVYSSILEYEEQKTGKVIRSIVNHLDNSQLVALAKWSGKSMQDIMKMVE